MNRIDYKEVLNLYIYLFNGSTSILIKKNYANLLLNFFHYLVQRATQSQNLMAKLFISPKLSYKNLVYNLHFLLVFSRFEEKIQYKPDATVKPRVWLNSSVPM